MSARSEEPAPSAATTLLSKSGQRQNFVDQTARPDVQNAHLINEVPVAVSPTTDQSEPVSF